MTSQRFHTIAEASHRILNPISEATIDHLESLGGWQVGTTVLDLACGKGEMLCRGLATTGP